MGLRHVKDVFTLSGEDGTVVAGDVAVGTAAVKGDTTDSADVVIGDIPFPDCHCVDAFHFDLHRRPRDLDGDSRRKICQCRSFEKLRKTRKYLFKTGTETRPVREIACEQ
jgi:hypothetical protein